MQSIRKRSRSRSVACGRKDAGARHVRRGVAVAELAVCLPILFLVIFGSIEACNLLFMRQTLVAAAYEGALLGSRPGTTEAEILARVQTTLAARYVTSTSVDVDVNASDFAALRVGEKFTVHIEATSAGNDLGLNLFAPTNLFAVDVVGHKQ